MGGTSPCASCKALRRRCAKDCIFAPYFPPDDPQKFAMVHKVFGASNVGKMLQELPIYQRADAVSSLVYEANARMRDPVYGCVGAISCLQNQVYQLQMELAVAQAQILCIQMEQQENTLNQLPLINHHNHEIMADQIPEDEKSSSYFMSNAASTSFNSLEAQQYLSYFAPTSCSVIQDPLKRESLWT